MFRTPLDKILLTYKKNCQKANIYISSLDEKAIFKYGIDSETRALTKEIMVNSSLESIVKNLEKSSKKIIDDKYICKKYFIKDSDLEVLIDLINDKVGKPIDSDHIDIYKGVVGKVHELEWAIRTLTEVGIPVNKSDFPKRICLIL